MQVHGFARNVDWEVTKTADGDAPMVEMTLLPSDYTKAMWPADFKATQTITLKDGALTATMSVRAVWSYDALELAVVDNGTWYNRTTPAEDSTARGSTHRSVFCGGVTCVRDVRGVRAPSEQT